MKVITAVDKDFGNSDGIKLFLAGGITNCPDWQKDVIEKLSERSDLDKLTVFNPRRDNFPIDDPNASNGQIKWEFDRLQVMDIFSMFFCAGESDQPICMYELGRNLLAMHIRFPGDWKDRCVITADINYKRCSDVVIQTSLCTETTLVNCSDDYDTLINMHVDNIVKAYRRII